MSFTISSSEFSHNSAIPALYTCDGLDISPPLEWTAVPAGTMSLALIIADPDAPDPAAPQRTWVHWILYNIDAGIAGLTEDIGPQELPTGTLEGLNDWGVTGYGGPCPPIGRHRYFHKLYALDLILPDLHQPTQQQLLQAMAGHILAQTEIIGLYQRT